jgi:hypothetical protein
MQGKIRRLDAPAKPVTYSVEIYDRSDRTVPVESFYAAGPFQAFHSWDLISPWPWTLLEDMGPLAGKLLRVLRSEHGIWESDTEVTHKVLVYTEAVPEDEGARWWCRAGETA